MKVRDLLRRVDEAAPFRLAQEWDNVGLMVGGLDAEVGRVAVALDPVPQAVVAASERGCQALLCHHPLLFQPIRKLDLGSGTGRVIEEAITRGVAILAAHTNWDCAPWGVNVTLARLLGLEDVELLDPETGLGAKGVLPRALSMEEALARARAAWGLDRLDHYAPSGSQGRAVSRVALCGGSGGSLWPMALAWEADLYVTADMRYHELMDATGAGLDVAVADHGDMERASLPELATRIGAAGDVDVVLLDVRGLAAPTRSCGAPASEGAADGPARRDAS